MTGVYRHDGNKHQSYCTWCLGEHKNTVIRMKILYVLLPLSPFFLESDVAAVSINIHGRAGSSWHLIQDFTNVACDLNSTFFIHQNKGMFLWENSKSKRKTSKCISKPKLKFSQIYHSMTGLHHRWLQATAGELQCLLSARMLVGTATGHSSWVGRHSPDGETWEPVCVLGNTCCRQSSICSLAQSTACASTTPLENQEVAPENHLLCS